MIDNLLSGILGAGVATIATIGYSSFKDKKTNIEAQIKAFELIRNELLSIWERLDGSYAVELRSYQSGGLIEPLYASRDYFVAFENYSHDLGLCENTEAVKSIFDIYIHMKGFLDTASQYRHLFKLHEELSNLSFSSSSAASHSIKLKSMHYLKGMQAGALTLVSEYYSIEKLHISAIENIDKEVVKLRKSPFLFL